MSSTETSTETTLELELTLTDTARVKIREVMTAQELGADEQNLRVFVAGGGCGGPQFGLAFDRAQDDDTHLDLDGLPVIVDPMSRVYVHGATIDFIETPEITGFQVSVPRPEGSCGSGGCSSEGCGPAECGPDQQQSAGGGCGSGGCGC